MSRVLKGTNGITQHYNVLTHRGVDLGHRNTSDDNVIAHSDGVVVEVVKNYNKTDSTGSSYGNYIKIKHNNGYYTLYAHLKFGGVYVNKGDKVIKGQFIADMGNTGRSTAKHLHFEVRNTLDVRINPEEYLNADLPKMNIPFPEATDEELARRVWAGEFGSGDARKKALGSRYSAVQKLVNKGVGKTTNTTSSITYTVVKGDTLTKIAKKYNVSVDSLVKLNNIKNKNVIYVGQKIKIK